VLAVVVVVRTGIVVSEFDVGVQLLTGKVVFVVVVVWF